MLIPLFPDDKLTSKTYYKNDFQDYCKFLSYINVDKTDMFDYEPIDIDVVVKIHNWNIVKLSKYISLMICNGRDANYQNYIFETLLLHTRFYTKEDTQEKQVKKMIELQSSPLWVVKVQVKEKQKVFSLDNFQKYKSFNNLAEVVSLPLPSNEEEEIFIISTNFPQDASLTSLRDDFSLQPYRTFFAINNISPNSTYHLKGKVYHNRINDHYRYEDPSSFFKVLVPDINPIHRMSFDIESHTSKERPKGISDVHNIIFSFGVFIEYKGKHHGFVLINMDFLITLHILKKYPKMLVSEEPEYASQTQLDRVYEMVVKNERPDLRKKYLKCFDDYPILEKVQDNIAETVDMIFESSWKYLLCTELTALDFYRESLTFFDQSIHFYGNNYDIPMIMRRYDYLAYMTDLSRTFSVPSYYNTAIKLEFMKSHKKTKKVVRLEINNQAQNIDVYNAVLNFFPKEESYKLDYIAGKFFNLVAHCSALTTSSYKLDRIQYPSQLVKESIMSMFRYVSFINVSGISCLIDKSLTNLEKDEIVIMQVSEIHQSSLIERRVTVSIMKDDIRISEVEFNTDNFIDIVNYNIADCVIAFFVMMYLKYDENQLDTCNSSLMRPASYGKYETGVTLKGIIYAALLRENVFFKKSDIITEETIDGGFVIPPKENFVTEKCGMFDFNSLYPSIIISYNLSIENLLTVFILKDEEEYNIARCILQAQLDKKKYSITYIDSKLKIVIFALQYANGKPFQGVIGKTCSILMEERKKVKREMKTETDVRLKNLLDIKQNNLKIAVNSIYGQISSIRYPSILTSPEIGECVTFRGRRGLMTLSNWLSNAKIKDNHLYLNASLNDINVFQEEKLEAVIFSLFEYTKTADRWSGTSYTIDCIYGDTDSILLKFTPDEEVSNMTKMIDTHVFLSLIVNVINKLAFGKLVIECEKYIEWVALLAKKKYVSFYLTYNPNWTLETIKNPKYSTQYKNTGNQRGFTKSHQIIVRKEMEDIFSSHTIALDNIYDRVRKRVYQMFVEWIENYNDNNIDVKEFLSSSQFEDNYSEDFFKKIKVDEFNKRTDIDEEIVVGSRLFYLYTCHKSIEVSVPTKINDYFTVYSSTDKYTNTKDCSVRIMYEIYGRKLIQSIIGPFQKNSTTMVDRLLVSVLNRLREHNHLPLKDCSDMPSSPF